jgi:ferredoxin-NADP reductase
MIAIIDRFLNRFTMYRLTLYFLAALLGLATILGAFGVVPGGPLAVLSTTAVLLAACFLVNALFARVLGIRSNPESSLITALILALISGPVSILSDPRRAGILALAGAVAVASKYLLSLRRQHIFNPAAVGAFFPALLFGMDATWWVGNPALLPLVVVGGLLLARKAGRMRLVGAFLGLFIVFNMALGLPQGLTVSDALQSVLFVLERTSLVFFATVMFTEPMTSPKRFSLQLVYAAIVAFLYQPQLTLFGRNLTPEEALLLGNLFSFIVSPSFKLSLKLKERREIARGIISFAFPRPAGLSYRTGQFMEWTLPLKKGDGHGARRYFSIASSPTEADLLIAARFSTNGSRYKRHMAAMACGDPIVAGELGGDFVLPSDPRLPLAFLAGGIGITPFRAMIKYLVDKNEHRDIVLLYSNYAEDEIVFRDVFDEAERTIGLKAVYTLTDLSRIRCDWCGRRGLIDARMIREEVPGLGRRRFFVSGSPAMVSAMKRVLRSVGVPARLVRTDSFLGYSS